jgi:hypothetical protein
MKKLFKSSAYASLFAITLFFTSCQEEYEPVFEVSEDNITASSETANLMSQMAANDGSFDNIVDGSSCFDISFPYEVEVNGLEITIDSVEDLKLIEEIFDALDSDEDILNIIFPVTIMVADYTEITINNIEELQEIAKDCIEGGQDDDIECIDVIYPVTFLTFDLNQTQTGTIEIGSDMELRRFFAGLDDEDIISIQFPVAFELYDGTKIEVNDIMELREAMIRAKDACDEDDDDDYNDDDFTEERLDALLVECPWLVKEVKRNDQDSSDQYENYLMTFSEDGIVEVKDRDGNVLYGEWNTRISDYRAALQLEFDVLVDFSLLWYVYEIDGSKIKLFASDGDKIILKTTCGQEPEVCDADFIEETLATCEWVISSPTVEFLTDYVFDFSNLNIHAYNPNGEIEDEGNWSIDGEVLMFNDLSMTFANYIGEWVVIECASDRFKMKRQNGDEYEYLVFEKVCD